MLRSRLGLAAALATAISWGSMFSIMAHVLGSLDPFWLTTIRYVGAALVLGAILLAVEGPRAFRTEGRGLQIFGLGSAGIAVYNLLMLNGMRLSGPEHSALWAAMVPAFVTLILWLRTGVRPSAGTLAGIVVAFAGVTLVITDGRLGSLAHGSLLGDTLIAAASVGIALYTVGSAAFRDWSWLRFTTLSIIGGAIATVAATLVATAVGVAHVPHAVDGSVIAGMLYLVLVAAVFGFIAWNYAIAAIGAQNTVLFMNAVPIVAFVVALVLGKHFSPVEYLGAALTIAALIYNNRAQRAPAAVQVQSPIANVDVA